MMTAEVRGCGGESECQSRSGVACTATARGRGDLYRDGRRDCHVEFAAEQERAPEQEAKIQMQAEKEQRPKEQQRPEERTERGQILPREPTGAQRHVEREALEPSSGRAKRRAGAARRGGGATDVEAEMCAEHGGHAQPCAQHAHVVRPGCAQQRARTGAAAYP